MILLHSDSYVARAVELQPLARHPAIPALLGVVLTFLVAGPALALITVGKGNDPVSDNNWPAGSLAVANLKARLGWYEGPPFGGGQHCFLYRGDAKALQEALDLFARIQAPKLELFVHEGPHESFVLKDAKDPRADARVDWSFTVWNPDNWNRLYGNPKETWNADDPNFGKPMAAPRMDVYVGDATSGVDWWQVKVPANVTVSDGRASANGFKDGSVAVGDVVDLRTGKPVAGAEVVLAVNKGQDKKTFQYVYETVASARSDAAGHFEVKNVPPGDYRVSLSAAGMAPKMLGYVHFGKDTIHRYKAGLSPVAVISGTVTDPAGKPVAGANVRVDSIVGSDGLGYPMPDRADVTTDAEGTFRIENLPPGRCQLFTHLQGYHGIDVLKTYDVPADAVALKMQAAGTFKARVTTADGTPPAQQYMVEVTPEGGNKIGSWGGSGDVKKDGTIQFETVPPGKYVVTARPNPGRSDEAWPAKTIEIKGGETTEVAFTVK